jgi:hypothetical protein
MDPIFEIRKKDLLEKLNALRGQTDEAATPSDAAAKPDCHIALYGAHSPFFDDLGVELKKMCDAASFQEVEAIIEYCADQPVYSVILDMDLPTDWRMSTDVFTNVKMLKPVVKFVLLTKNPESTPVRTLAAQGALVLAKPFKMDSLRDLLCGSDHAFS